MTIERSTRARFTAAFVLVMVLGAGVVLGMAIDRTLGQRGDAGEVARSPGNRSGPDSRSRGGFEPRSNRMLPPPGDSTQRRPPLIVEQVGLSEAQEAQVDSILSFYGERMRDLHSEFDQAYSSRYREITQATREAIKGILTAEQRVAYDSLLVEWNRRRQERRTDSLEGNEGSGGGS